MPVTWALAWRCRGQWGRGSAGEASHVASQAAGHSGRGEGPRRVQAGRVRVRVRVRVKK